MKDKAFVLIVLAVLLSWNVTQTDAYNVQEFPICTSVGDQEQPCISGKLIIWQDRRNDNWDIYGYDMLTQTEFPVCTHSASQMEPAIDGDFIVWGDFREGPYIYGFLQSSIYPIRFESLVSESHSGQGYPAINGNFIVWSDNRSGNWDIYGYNISTGFEFPICTNTAEQKHPSISGDIVVWQDYRNASTSDWDIYAHDLSTQTEFPVSTNSFPEQYPDISGHVIVWQKQRSGTYWDIYGYDLSTQSEFPICTASEDQRDPAIDGNVVVWYDDRYLIRGYDIHSQTEFAISTHTGPQDYPDISGDIVVWQDARSLQDWDIYGAHIESWHDLCYSAVEVTEGVPYNGSTGGASGTDETTCAYNDTADVWHSYTPTTDGYVSINLRGSKFDTTLAIFDTCRGTELACNDDYWATQSQVTLKLTADRTFFIRVAGFNGQTGDYTLNISGPECTGTITSDLNNDCKVDLLDLAILSSQWLDSTLIAPADIPAER